MISDVSILKAIPPAERKLGDYDSNGITDLGDYNHWRTTFSSFVVPGTGSDGNGDGIVNAADYTIWRDAINKQIADLIPGDFDDNGLVSIEDYQLWEMSFGESPASPGAGADGNGDGIVNAADYTIWRDAFMSVGISQLRSVPEPSSSINICVICAFMFAFKKRRSDEYAMHFECIQH